MRLVLSFLMALSAVAVLVLGAAPASAMTGPGGCHEAVAVDHGADRQSPAAADAHVMHCCVGCTPQAALPVLAPQQLTLQPAAALAPPDLTGRAPAPDPDPPRT